MSYFCFKVLLEKASDGISEFAVPGIGKFDFVPERSDHYYWIFFIF